jgi:hypothetical protein
MSMKIKNRYGMPIVIPGDWKREYECLPKECPADFVTGFKDGWDLENPSVGAYYRIDQHRNQDAATFSRPNTPRREFSGGRVGDYVQLTSLYTAFDEVGEARPMAKYKNLNTGRFGSFERHSMFAGALTPVDEMEALLYAKERKD